MSRLRVEPVARHLAQPLHRLEVASEVVKESIKTGRSVREIVLERGLLSEDELDRALDVLGMTEGGVRR